MAPQGCNNISATILFQFGITGIETVKKPRRRCPGQSSGGCVRGGKKPTARSINRILKLFSKFQNPHSGAKILFRHAEFSLSRRTFHGIVLDIPPHSLRLISWEDCMFYGILAAFAVFSVVLDQVVKYLVVQHIPLGGVVP